ncbi:MAG: SDR family oxidoreductase [Crocinitomicaceae bacterium]
MKIQNKKILVTGAAGFIGSNLVEDLLLHNNEVIGLDNLSTGFLHNLTASLENPQFKFIQGDIRDLATCNEACMGVDIVLHQAALGSVPRSLEDPIATNEVNITGFLNMLVAARDAEVDRFVYASSSSTYGDSTHQPKEEGIIGNPLSPYAVTKRVNELYAEVFAKNYNLETIGLRYFNVYGKHQSPNGAYAAVIPKFVDLLLKHESPMINGDGSFSRDFTYIDNVIQMIHLAATTENKEALGQVFNTAVGDRTTLLELTELLKEHLGEYDEKIRQIPIIHGPNRAGDIPHSLASIEKAKKLLNYNPSHQLNEGLKEAMVWYWNENQKV